MSNLKPVVFIVGPTATGKSQFALTAAREFGASIVNCDSLQFYKPLNIGTAKPTAEDRQVCPHYLFDIKDINEEFTAGEFRREALSLIEKKRPTEQLFFVGGSGFYIQALDKGMYEVPSVPSEIEASVQSDLEAKGLAALYSEVVKLDPIFAKSISSQDQYRIFRALCLMRTQGRSMTEIKKEFAQEASRHELPGPKIKIGITLNRKTLRQRVEHRLEKMIEAGLIDEVKALLSQGLSQWPPLKSVGYKETVAYLQNELDEESWKSEIVKNTMRLAKRQMTWFKRDQETQWFDAEEAWDKPLSFLREKIII